MRQAFVSRVRSPFTGIAVAVLAGYLITEAIPWREIEPVYRLPLSMSLRILLGIGIGRMYPDHWGGLSLFTAAGPFAQAVVESMTRTINLLPIALIAHVALVFPVLLGGFIGKLLAARSSRR